MAKTCFASKWERSHVGAIVPNRLRVRAFADSTLRDRFFNGQFTNDWRVCEHPGVTGSGLYVQIAGQWVNVKKLPPETLAHV